MFLKRFFKKTRPKSREDLKASFKLKYPYFKEVLTSNNDVLEIITDIEQKLLSHEVFGMSYVRSMATQAVFHTSRMVKDLNLLSCNKYKELDDVIEKIIGDIKTELSRGFKVPSILDTRVATEKIHTGIEVTEDAYSGTIYKGLVEAKNKDEEAYIKDTPIYKTLDKIASLTVPLHLTDHMDKSFIPNSCRSLHDITRYVYEMSFAEMFKICNVLGRQEGAAVKLDAPLPIDLYIIDLGGGLNSGAEAAKVKPDVITSAPFKVFLKGMMHPDIRWHEPRIISFRGLLSTVANTTIRQPHPERDLGDKSYAIISDKYLNFNSRVGYHFSTIDTYCGNSINKNYINFSFKGGAADDTRRIRRVRFIAAVLEKLNFTVQTKDDLVYARIQKYDHAITEERLDMLGRLTLCTRQLDMLMDTESRITWFVNAFMEGNFNFDPDFKKA
jgi:pyruvate,water dikinase